MLVEIFQAGLGGIFQYYFFIFRLFIIINILVQKVQGPVGPETKAYL